MGVVQVEPAGERPVVEVLLLGGRSGVGKTSVGFEVSAQLQAAGVGHCLIDGDNLDAAYPKPPDDPSGERLVETNLRALWSTYAAGGHHRLVYVNTTSVLAAGLIRRAGAPDAIMHGVLLTADDQTVHQRLRGREIGSTLARHLEARARPLSSSSGLRSVLASTWGLRRIRRAEPQRSPACGTSYWMIFSRLHPLAGRSSTSGRCDGSRQSPICLRDSRELSRSQLVSTRDPVSERRRFQSRPTRRTTTSSR